MPATAEQSTTGVVDPRPRRAGAAENRIEFRSGEWYQMPKDLSWLLARLDRLSSEARRVHEFLRPASFGFHQELAVKVVGGKEVPLTPSDIAKSDRFPKRRSTGLSKQHVRRALRELENAGLGRVEGDQRGQIRIYLFAEPRDADQRSGSRARLPNDPFPSWVPTTWSPLKPLFKRLKMAVSLDEEAARDYFEEGERIARIYEETQKEVRAFVERVGAHISSIYKEERKDKERHTQRTDERFPEPEPVAPVPEAEFVCESSSSSSNEVGTEPKQHSVSATAEQVDEPARAEAPPERPPHSQGAPNDTKALTRLPFDPGPAWEVFWRLYSRGHPFGYDARELEAKTWWFTNVKTPQYAAQICTGLRRHIESDPWSRGIGVPFAINFLQRHQYRNTPPARQATADELERQENERLLQWARERDRERGRGGGGGGYGGSGGGA